MFIDAHKYIKLKVTKTRDNGLLKQIWHTNIYREGRGGGGGGSIESVLLPRLIGIRNHVFRPFFLHTSQHHDFFHELLICLSMHSETDLSLTSCNISGRPLPYLRLSSLFFLTIL